MTGTSSGKLTRIEARQLDKWQRNLLPFVISSLVLMGAFFFISSIFQLERLNEAVSYEPDTRVIENFNTFDRANPDATGDLAVMKWKTLALMEENTLRSRYAQVNATLMLRAWTRHLGFLTGMILAFVGAIFILAKLREAETNVSVEGGGIKGTLVTNSPGIILSILGAGLMVVTLLSNFEFSTNDASVYLPREASPAEEFQYEINPAGGLPEPGIFIPQTEPLQEDQALSGE